MPTKNVEDVTIDMSTAKVLEPVPTDKAYLCVVSKWKLGTSQSSGGRKLSYELTVQKPEEFANRKIPTDLSLENEYTLGTYKTLLLGLGYPEEMVNSRKHVTPKEEDALGRQCTVWFGIRKSDQYGDRNTVRRIRGADVFSEVSNL